MVGKYKKQCWITNTRHQDFGEKLDSTSSFSSCSQLLIRSLLYLVLLIFFWRQFFGLSVSVYVCLCVCVYRAVHRVGHLGIFPGAHTPGGPMGPIAREFFFLILKKGKS